MSDAAKLRKAVVASQAANEVTADLAVLVHRLAKKRIGVAVLAEDLAQHVLTYLVRKLPEIDPDQAVELIGSALVGAWRHHMRQRRTEQRYLLWLAGKLIDDLPPHARHRYRGPTIGAALRRYKYY